MEVTKAIVEELTLSYASCGRTPSMAMDAVAESLQQALKFSSAEHVHRIFQKARSIENIPTQKTLADCIRNHAEEVLKYEGADSGTGKLEYFNPVSNWLPEDSTRRRVNVRTAIKNYCIAVGDKSYSDYCQIHLVDEEMQGDRKVVRWKFPEKVKAFDEPIKEYLEYLYGKYLRMTPCYANFPRGNSTTLEMIPPSIREIRIMLNEEAKLNNNA